MKQRHLLALLQENYTTIEVRFPKDGHYPDDDPEPWDNRPRNSRDLGKTYTYKIWLTTGIDVGDKVVVDSTKKGLLVAQVVEVHAAPKIDIDASFTYKWVIQKVDTTQYESQLAKDANFDAVMLEVERTRQREMLLGQFRDGLPEHSAARKLFEKATGVLLEGNHEPVN